MNCGWGRQSTLIRKASGSAVRWRQVRITDIRMLCALARPGTVAAPDLAIHHCRTNRLLGPMVCRLNRWIDQEPEPLHRMIQEMAGQAAIRFVREGA